MEPQPFFLPYFLGIVIVAASLLLCIKTSAYSHIAGRRHERTRACRMEAATLFVGALIVAAIGVLAQLTAQ